MTQVIKPHKTNGFGCEDVEATQTASSDFASFIHVPNVISLSSPIKVGLAPRQVTMPFPCLCSIRGDAGTAHQKELLKSLYIRHRMTGNVSRMLIAFPSNPAGQANRSTRGIGPAKVSQTKSCSVDFSASLGLESAFQKQSL